MNLETAYKEGGLTAWQEPRKAHRLQPFCRSRQTPAKTPDTHDVITVQEVMKKIGLTAFHIDFMKAPEDALSSYRLVGKGDAIEGEELNSRLLEVWERLHFERLMNDVIKLTGADPEQLRDPKRQTPEQQQALLEAGAREQGLRMQLFFKSRYFQAFKALESIEGKYHSAHDGDPEYIGVKEQAILYYFASHEDIDPTGTEALTDAQTMELVDLFYRLDKFYLEEAPKDNDDASPEPVTLYKFIESENPNTNLPIIITKKLQEIVYPVDKVNSSIGGLWGLMPGQQAELKAESDRDSSKGKQASIYVLLDFDEMRGTGVSISRPLTSYDKRVFIAAANLKEQGHDTVTTSQLYEAMGNRGRPSANQRQKILKSIETMSLCRVTLDNSEEAALYTKYDKVKRTFYLLPTTIDKGYVNGLIVDDAITIIELPRLFIFAKKRGQFATTPVALLESPMP